VVQRRRGSGDWETSQNAWGGSSLNYSLGAGNQASPSPFIGLVPPNPTAATSLTVGRVIISEIDITVDITNTGSDNVVRYGVGIFPTEYDTSGAIWATRSPLLPGDATRDDWLFLEVGTFFGKNAPSITQNGIRIRRHLKGSWTLGQGDGLILMVANSSLSNTNFYYNSFVRWKQRRVL
jgi:hypothetical protein